METQNSSFFLECHYFYRLLQLILDGADSCRNHSSIDIRETEESSVQLNDYPFSITKGCYLAIEKEYEEVISQEQKDTIRELINVILVDD